MSTNGTNKKAELIYPELSYALMGICFEVSNTLGTKYQEKHYQRAIEAKLKELKIPHQREVMFEIWFGGEKIGKIFADFVVDGKIVLEVKKVWKISGDDVKQVLRYLKESGLKLGIIVNFYGKRVEFKRVLN